MFTVVGIYCPDQEEEIDKPFCGQMEGGLMITGPGSHGGLQPP